MEAQLESIRDQQKEVWNRFSPGWKKWDEFNMNFLKLIGDNIIHQLNPKGTDIVLDIASGTGEPGLTIASLLNGGLVVATDLSEGMLEIAKENASRRGIKNFETVVSDVSDLPFADSSFDLISCRLGFMFFPDVQHAANEMVRVLRPGGKIATAVWYTPENNFWASGILGIINKNMELPVPPQGAPGLFRCARSGFIADIFNQAGLENITETEVHGKFDFESVETYWDYMTDVVAPVVAALAKADEATRGKIKKEVFELVHQKYSGDRIAIDYSALVVYGEKG